MKNLLLLLGIAYGLMCIIKLFLWVYLQLEMSLNLKK